MRRRHMRPHADARESHVRRVLLAGLGAGCLNIDP